MNKPPVHSQPPQEVYSDPAQQNPAHATPKKSKKGLIIGLILGGVGLVTVMGGAFIMLIIVVAISMDPGQNQSGFGYQNDGYNTYYSDGGYSGRMTNGTVDPNGENSVYSVDGEVLDYQF